MWEFECPVCHTNDCVLPVGSKASKILIIGDKPGEQELKEGKPFVGATGAVLRTELSRVGVDLGKLRITNLWQHAPNTDSLCLDYGAKKAIEESKGKKVILLIGSETVKYFCKLGVEEWNGLEVESPWFPDAKVLACVQPTVVFHSGLGEFRFAMKQFSDLLKSEGVI